MRSLLLLALLVVGCAPEIKNASAGDSIVAARNGAVNCNTTATALPASPMAGRNTIIIQNRGAASIYVGADSSVSSTTGIEVVANGSLSIDVGYRVSNSQGGLYCVAPGGLQVSPANTRWLEVR